MKNNSLKFVMALLITVPVCSSDSEPEIGKLAPDFSQTDIQGTTIRLSDYRGKFIVLEWMNLGCPFIKKHYDSGNMQALQKEVIQKGGVWLSICSSAKGKEGFLLPEDWIKACKKNNTNADAIILDSSGTVGKSYNAKTTPHMFIIDTQGILIYKGAIDDKQGTDKEEIKTARNYVREAFNNALNGKAVEPSVTKSYGCSVKYAD